MHWFCFQCISLIVLHLLHHHIEVKMSVTASPIIGKANICSIVCLGWRKRNFKAPHYWSLCGEFLGDQRIPFTRAYDSKAFPCHDVIKTMIVIYSWNGNPVSLRFHVHEGAWNMNMSLKQLRICPFGSGVFVNWVTVRLIIPYNSRTIDVKTIYHVDFTPCI